MARKEQYIYGSPILLGDNTIPGVKKSAEIEELIPKIIKACMDYGIDPYPPMVEILTYDEISEVAAYGGFPVRYPHWQFGMEYEELARGFEFGGGRIYEMVANANPAPLYCLDSNTLLDQITVIAHALFHSDFFKNNIWFEPTTHNAMNELADHGTRIRRYMDKYGEERVVQFIDWALSIDDLVDIVSAWKKRNIKKIAVRDRKTYRHPRKLKLPESDGTTHDYMDEFINNDAWKQSEKKRIIELEVKEELDIHDGYQKDVMGYLVNHAPLNLWQQDILAMIYEEAKYFAPQRITKTINEGWASFGDYQIMARQHWAGGEGIVEYARHKTGVLGGKYSMNPYAIGFKLFCHIEERWNKGRFGTEWDLCDDAQKKENWDLKLGLGQQKIFEVRAYHNDITFISEFMDQEFVDKFEMYHWKAYPRPDGGVDYRIESRDVKKIKKLLLDRHRNGGRPDIQLADPNYGGKRIFLLQHKWDGRILHRSYAEGAMQAIWNLWNNGGFASKYPVALASSNKDGEEIVYVCQGNRSDMKGILKRSEFEENFG